MKYLWLDLETAGLAVDAPILEIYCMMGDATRHEEPFHAVIRHDVGMLHDYMSEYVLKMHQCNGLLAEVPSGCPLNDVEDALLEYLKPYRSNEPLILAGASVQYDLRWLQHHMPRFAEHLHYSVLDTSSLWQLLHTRFPKEFSNDDHRAKSDVHNAYQQYVYYHQCMVHSQEKGKAQTVGDLRKLLQTYPDTVRLCTTGVFDEFRPVRVTVKSEIFSEDDQLRDRTVIGAAMTLTPLFE